MRLAATQAFPRTHWGLYLPVVVDGIMVGVLLTLAVGPMIPDMDPKRFITIAPAVLLAVGAILQAILASLISTRHVPPAPSCQHVVDPAKPDSKVADEIDSGWPDLLNLIGWGSVACGAILAAIVVIGYP